jgi:hypothetical protein
VFVATLAALLTTVLILGSGMQPVKADDVSPPQLVSFDFSPKTIDVGGGSQIVTFTVRVTDELSGLESGSVGFSSPSRLQYRENGFGWWCRVSGDEHDGWYQNTILFPQYSESGIWIVNNVMMQDQVGNYRTIYTSDLASRGFPTTIQVTSVPDDVSPPQLVSFDFSPKTIDVGGGSQIVTFTVRVTDELSGLESGSVGFSSPSRLQYRENGFGWWCRVSGDEHDGWYQNTILFPQYSESGIWIVNNVMMQDQVGNYRTIYTSDLASRGFPTTLTVLSGQTNLPPSAPQNFAADPVVKGIRLTWTAPSSVGSSPIQTYRIYRGTSPGTETLCSSTDASATEYKDMSVSADSLYYYYIKAVNSAGEGPASPEVKCSSKESIKGIETVTTLSSFQTYLNKPFTIQQNFFIQFDPLSPGNYYWVQNIILIEYAYVGNLNWAWRMAGGFEIHNYVNYVDKGTLLSFYSTVSAEIPIPTRIVLLSKIEDKQLVLQNDAHSRYVWNVNLPTGSFIRQQESTQSGWGSPEISIVGAPLPWDLSSAQFLAGTHGHVETYTRIGGSSWIFGNSFPIESPNHASTRETSTGLDWKAGGDFDFVDGSTDGGLFFLPDYSGSIVPPPSPTSPNTNALTVGLFCPADLSIYDSLGNHDGFNSTSGTLDLNIPESSLFIGEDMQCITLHNSNSGPYSIIVTGTATGNYTVSIKYTNATQIAIQSFNGTISTGESKYYSALFSETEQMTSIFWEYMFNDAKRGTMLKISTNDKYFQFTAPGKDFGVKRDPNMNVICGAFVISYKDSAMQLVAAGSDDIVSFCTATARDRQTGKQYLLVQKPVLRCHPRENLTP